MSYRLRGSTWIIGNDTVSKNLNFIFLILKYYTFQNVSSPLPLSLNAFLQKLKKIYIEQEFVAKINLSAEKFYKKWNLIASIIQTIWIYLNTLNVMNIVPFLVNINGISVHFLLYSVLSVSCCLFQLLFVLLYIM